MRDVTKRGGAWQSADYCLHSTISRKVKEGEGRKGKGRRKGKGKGKSLRRGEKRKESR